MIISQEYKVINRKILTIYFNIILLTLCCFTGCIKNCDSTFECDEKNSLFQGGWKRVSIFNIEQNRKIIFFNQFIDSVHFINNSVSIYRPNNKECFTWILFCNQDSLLYSSDLNCNGIPDAISQDIKFYVKEYSESYIKLEMQQSISDSVKHYSKIIMVK